MKGVLIQELTVNEHTDIHNPMGYGKPCTKLPIGTEGEMYVSPDQNNLWFDWIVKWEDKHNYPYGRHHGKVMSVFVPYSCSGYNYSRFLRPKEPVDANIN